MKIEEVIENAYRDVMRLDKDGLTVRGILYMANEVRAWMEEQGYVKMPVEPCKVCNSIKVKTHCADCGWGDENNEAGD